MVALQGYNYGMSGWITWINQHGGVYTLALSQEYSRTRMPEGAKGTPEHAQLVMRYYTYNNVGGTTMLSGNGGVDVVYYSQADPRWGGTDLVEIQLVLQDVVPQAWQSVSVHFQRKSVR